MRKQQTKIKLMDLQNTVDIEMKVIPIVTWLELSEINADIKKLDKVKIKVLNRKTMLKKF